jgi:hypothetical protein
MRLVYDDAEFAAHLTRYAAKTVTHVHHPVHQLETRSMNQLCRFMTILPLSAALAAISQMGSAPASAPVPPSGTTLALIGLTTQSILTGDTIKTRPHQTITIENGHTHASETYSGVPLVMLLAQVGAPTGKDVHGKALSEYIVATGADGYKAVLALAEAEPDFHPGQILVADELAGKPLDTSEGPFKLVVSEDKHPARSVHNLVKLELKQAE